MKPEPSTERTEATISATDAAKLLGVSLSAVADAWKRGTLQRIERGRYLKSELLAYKERRNARKPHSRKALAAMRANAARMRERKAAIAAARKKGA